MHYLEVGHEACATRVNLLDELKDTSLVVSRQPRAGKEMEQLKDLLVVKTALFPNINLVIDLVERSKHR